MTPVLSVEVLRNARRIALGALCVGIFLVGAGAFHVFALKKLTTDLRVERERRESQLRDDQRIVDSAPKETQLAALDRSRAVSCLRSKLSDIASHGSISVQEFQAGTDELPYLTVYAADNKDPGWMQVPVRITLSGHATALSTILSSLHDLEVPFEVDNVEFTRRSTDNSGMATVSEQIQMRVLFYEAGA